MGLKGTSEDFRKLKSLWTKKLLKGKQRETSDHPALVINVVL